MLLNTTWFGGRLRRSIASVACTLAFGLSSSVGAQDNATSHSHYAGPMSKFLAIGAVPAPHTSGLPFTIVLTDRGASISPASFDLQAPGWQGSAKLSLEGLKFTDGHLTAIVKVMNASGNILEGVRLDIVGATEEYKVKDSTGKEITKTRGQNAMLESPLLFADIPRDEESDSLAFAVSGTVFQPDTTQIRISGVLSGLTYLSHWVVDDVIAPLQLDYDAQNRLYLADSQGERVVRVTEDGKNATTIGKLPDQQCIGVAINRKTGKIYATCFNIGAIFQYTAEGGEAGKIIVDKLDTAPHLLRTDLAGHLYGAGDGSCIYLFEGDQYKRSFTKIGDYDINATGFDVAADNTLWICSNGNLLRMDADGKTGKRVAYGPDWRLGRVYNPLTCRVDAKGQVYVVEGGSEDEANFEFPRVSVWDKQGRPLRLFGFGGKPAHGDKELIEGQIRNVSDIAVLPDGNVAVLGKIGQGNSAAEVSLFKPF